MHARFPVLLLAAVALLATAPVARANFFAGDVVDPGPGVSAAQGADLASDGTGGVAYLRNQGGVDHLFVARLVHSGEWDYVTMKPDRLR